MNNSTRCKYKNHHRYLILFHENLMNLFPSIFIKQLSKKFNYFKIYKIILVLKQL